MDYLIPLLERVERVERCKRPWMWGIEKDREGAGCFFAKYRGLEVMDTQALQGCCDHFAQQDTTSQRVQEFG